MLLRVIDTACFVKFGGNSTGGTFGVSFHNDSQNGEFKLQLQGVRSERHSIEIEPISYIT